MRRSSDEQQACVERAARLGCANQARPHRCAQRSATIEAVGEVDGLVVLRCTRCGWAMAVEDPVIVVDDRDLDPRRRRRFEVTCDELGIKTQDATGARSRRSHRRSAQSEVRDGFDKRSRHWEENRRSFTETFGNSNRLKANLLGIVHEVAEDRPPAVADFGCGTGGLLERTIQAAGGGHFAGVDVSPMMISRAADRLAPLRGGVALDLVVGSAEGTPLRTDSFDVVTAELALHHVRDPRRVLAEMARVVRPDGRVLVQVPGPGYSLDVNYGRGWKSSRIEPKTLPATTDPLGRFGVEELQRLGASVGLRPEHVDVDPWQYRFETAESCLVFLGRTGADARVRGYAAPLDLFASYGHVLEIGPLEVRGEFVTLTASKGTS